jgi:outer membrane cobalamin receptor
MIVTSSQLLRRSIGASCIALALSCAAARAAQPPAPSPSPSAPPEIGHVVTTDRQDESPEAAVRTTYVVTKAQIVTRGYATIADALTSVPGVIVERYGAFGSAANVGIRGSSSSQVLVLLDGRPIGGAQAGTLDLGEISTSGVERIEVVEGGGATLYGAGAIGGAINILTTRAAGAPLVRASDASFGSSSLDAETRAFAFERIVAGNAYDYVGTSVPSGTRINADAESTTARVRGDATLGAVAAQGSLGLTQFHVGAPGAIALPFASPGPNPSLSSSYQSATTRQDTTDADARATFSLERGNTTTSLDLAATRRTLLYYSLPGDPLGCFTPSGTQPCDDYNQETRVQASLRRVLRSSATRLIYGIDVARGDARIDAGDGNPPTHAFAQTAAYAQDGVTLGRVQAYAGVRAERDGGQGGAVAPSAGFAAPLSPALTIRANYATGFRAPDAVDLYYPGFSNPTLQPERTQGTDLTLTDARMLGGVSLGYFTLAGNNLIAVNPAFNFSAPPGPSNEPVINAQHASIAGLTLDARAAAHRGFTATLAVTDLYRALDLTSVARRLVGRPVFSTSLALEYAAPSPGEPRAAFGLIARSMGARGSVPAFGSIDPTQFAAAYTTVDGYVRMRVSRGELVSLRGRNLGNERYSAIASPPFGGFPAPGRSFAIELSTR